MKDVSHVLIMGDFNLLLINWSSGHVAITLKIPLVILLLIVSETHFSPTCDNSKTLKQ